MDILIIGAGRVGRRVINTLSIEDNVDVIDSNLDALSKIRAKNVNKINRDILEEDLLNKIDFEKYDYCLALTDKDKANILIASKTCDLKVKTFVLLNTVDTKSEIKYLKESLNISEIINREYAVSKYLKKIINNVGYYPADYFGKGKIEVSGYFIDVDTEFVNHRLEDIGSLSTILVVGILRDASLIIPDGKTVLKKGDYLYLMGLSQDINNFKNTHFKIEYKKGPRDVTILGGSLFINKELSQIKDISLKIIEEDVDKAKLFRKQIPNAFVVNREFKSDNLLEDENLKKGSFLINMTEDDELNIVNAMLANTYGLKTIVKTIKNSYSKLLDLLGFYTHIDENALISNEITSKLKRGSRISVNLMFGGEAEVVEIEIPEDFKHIDKALMDIYIPSGIIIGGIIREDSTAVVPRGKTKILKGDKLVIFCTNNMREEMYRFLGRTNEEKFLGIF